MRIDSAGPAFLDLDERVRATDFRRPVQCLLGLPIDAVSKEEAIARIRAASATRSPCWMSTSNTQYLVATQRDTRFRDTVILSDLSVADGTPLVWAARLLGIPIPERVAGADLFEALLRGEAGALKIFFFGGPEGVAELACSQVNALSGPVTCVGFEFPGFGTVEQMSNPQVIDRINRSGADFVVVALGAMKGQAWIERNRGVLHAPVISHLGAVVNYVAGTLTRAPLWMRKVGLEWLWRIREEPGLWRRYWDDATTFLPLLATRVIARLTYRCMSALERAPAPAKVDISTGESMHAGDSAARAGNRVTRATLSGFWSETDMPLLRNTFAKLSSKPGDIELDVSNLARVNGIFIALLMLLHGHQKRNGCLLTFLSPDAALRRTLKFHCAEFLLDRAAGK